tara:strand:- start:20063 stop:20263 length:201 start_codon:yes stop_codon:yes gene_type:complete
MFSAIRMMVLFALLAVIAADPKVEARAKEAFPAMWASGDAGKEAARNLARKAMGIPVKPHRPSTRE